MHADDVYGNDTKDNPQLSSAPKLLGEVVGMIGTKVANSIMASGIQPPHKQVVHMAGTPMSVDANVADPYPLRTGCRPHMTVLGVARPSS
jgi:hypothetical protein